MSKDSLYNEAVKVTESYLGPAGERFIRRQITTHLEIEPELLDKKNLSILIDWVSVSFALLTNKEDDIASYTNKLYLLSNSA